MENDAVFFDAVDHCPSFNPTDDDSPAPSASVSTVSDPQPAPPEPRNSHPQPPSPASTLRRQKIRRHSNNKEPEHLSFDSSLASVTSDFINGERTSFRNRTNIRSPKEDESPAAEKRDSSEAQAQHASVVTEEEKTEESTVTTAANDDAAGDSADSANQLVGESSSFLELVAGLVIKVIGFQIKIIAMFVTYPMLFAFHCCMFCVDPLGTARKFKVFVIRVLARARGAVFGCIEPHVTGLLREGDSVLSVAFRCGWGLLWSIYVCCVLFGLLVNSFVLSGFLMKCFVEKPVRMREVLNFDYTKPSPVAYVPIMSCDGVVFGGKDSGDNDNNVGVWNWKGERVIPYKHKVQVTVLLTVPESGYNRDLGVFQARVDFLSSSGKIIASSSQPCMLRFKSEPLRLIMTFLKIAPLITGYTSETQTLNVKMRGFVEEDVPTSCLKVTLEQRAEYQAGAGIPQMYHASLVVESELPFFKRIIWLWKMSIFIWITMIAFVMQLLFVLVCCRPMIIPRTRQRQRVASARGSATQNNLQVQS